MTIVEKQYNNPQYCGYYNIGPDECDCINTGELVDKICKFWGNGLKWINKNDGGPHEASFLGLDNSKIKETFNWHPIWHIDKALKEVLAWTKVYIEKGNIEQEMEKEIREFFNF